jgi:hypothetical protein
MGAGHCRSLSEGLRDGGPAWQEDVVSGFPLTLGKDEVQRINGGLVCGERSELEGGDRTWLGEDGRYTIPDSRVLHIAMLLVVSPSDIRNPIV